MRPHRIKRHRQRSHGGSHMALVPFIDMLTIMVVFLLVHTSDVDVLPNTKNISIPESVSQKAPKPTVVVMVTRDELLVDGRAIMTIAQLLQQESPIIAPLKEALQSQADTVLTGAQGQDIKDREVTIMGDRGTPYSVLRKIMATCTDAEYGKVSLAVIGLDGPARPPVNSGRTASLSGGSL